MFPFLSTFEASFRCCAPRARCPTILHAAVGLQTWHAFTLLGLAVLVSISIMSTVMVGMPLRKLCGQYMFLDLDLLL
jgi:hypothetical protein